MRGLDVVVDVPAAVGERHEPHAGFDEPPRQQHALARGVAAVVVPELGRLVVHVERLAGASPS